MYLISVFLRNIFYYPIRYGIFAISLHFVLYFLIARARNSYQRLGTKLLLGIMFKNEIIVLTDAVYSLYII